MRIFTFIFIAFFFSPLSLPADNSYTKVCIRGIFLEAEVADNPQQRQQGLMFRSSLADNGGMLFIFEKEGRYNFWMKNMNFALDIIWIGADKKIVDIKENNQPCTESCQSLISAGQARYVLEVDAGFVRKNKIKIGEPVNF